MVGDECLPQGLVVLLREGVGGQRRGDSCDAESGKNELTVMLMPEDGNCNVSGGSLLW